jgi:hypothetical protein
MHGPGCWPSRSSVSCVRITLTRFVDNSVNGKRSIVRFGVAFGQGFEGFQYWSEKPVFKTGDATEWAPYAVPQQYRDPIRQALGEMGCDVCHVEAVPLAGGLVIFDVNPYPTAGGKRRLSSISEAITKIMVDGSAAIRRAGDSLAG